MARKPSAHSLFARLLLERSIRAAVGALLLLILLAPLGSPAQAAPEMLTGSYVGDGSLNRAITGLDFAPAVVIIKGNINEVAVIRTSTMSGDNSKPMVGGTALTANLVKSPDANGFTVGGDARVNGSGIKYRWAAFKAEPGMMVVESYLGNGADGRDINSVGFQADLVFVMSEGGDKAIHRGPASTLFFNLNNNNANWFALPFPANGFRVSIDNRVNKESRIS
jgi:hypothetical protein